MDKMITITVDTNDADYMTKVSKISEEDLSIIREIATKIKTFKPYKTETSDYGHYMLTDNMGVEKEVYGLIPEGTIPTKISMNEHQHNWPEGECQRDDLGEKSPQEIYNLTANEIYTFDSFLPFSEWGFHTVKSITVAPITEIETLV